jgi:non-specific protein-tyrosine kinase
MRLTVTDENPDRAAAIANEVISVFVEQNVAVQAGRYASSLENLQSEMDRVQTDISTTEGQLATLLGNPQATLTPAQVEDRNHLQSLLADYRSSYSILLDRYEQIRLAQTQATDRVSVVEQAESGRPIRSTVQQTIPLQGAVVGVVLAVGIALLIEYLDDTIHGKEDLEQLTGVPTVGVISVIPSAVEPQDVLVAVHDPRSTMAEAYRLLTTNLEFATSEEAVHSLLVTSSTPQEGKSTTAANLAISLAQGGWQVILVDMDLRRPTLHKLFEIPNQTGLSVAVLQPSSGVIEHLTPAAVDNLYVMTSGPIPPNASDVLRSARMVEVMQELKAHADLVIIDTPPLMVVADPILIARLTDAILLVVQAGATRSGVLKQALELVDQSGLRLLGTVLNQVKSRGDGSYYYYDYYYYEDNLDC